MLGVAPPWLDGCVRVSVSVYMPLPGRPAPASYVAAILPAMASLTIPQFALDGYGFPRGQTRGGKVCSTCPLTGRSFPSRLGQLMGEAGAALLVGSSKVAKRIPSVDYSRHGGTHRL